MWLRSRAWALLAVLVMVLVVPNALTASARPPSTRNSPPNTPTDLATEYPQPEPVLHATFSDPDGGTGQVLYTIYDSSGAVQVQDSGGPTVPSGSDSSYTVPLGILADGEQYRWTARSFDGSKYSASTTEPNYVATSLPSLEPAPIEAEDSSSPGIEQITPNPWGCAIKALNGHWTSPYIKAEGQINCGSSPFGVTLRVYQELYRSSWSGWRFVASNNSYCDSGNHNSGQPYPQCHPGWALQRMQAYVWWNCGAAGFSGNKYNYLNKAWAYIYQGSTTYSGYHAKQTGNWNDPGTVKCGS